MKRKETIVKKDYTDPLGIPRRVFIPPDESDLSIGIPASLDLSSLYAHMPPEFQQRFYTALHAVGLVEAGDYFKPGADARFKSALLTIIRQDFLSVQRLAKEELKP